MRKFAVLALLFLAIGLSGCVNAPSSYGNFIPNTSADNDKKIADDAVQKLVTLYPPASTRFDMQHTATDFFGSSMIEAMRAKGYAILEFKPEKKARIPAVATEPQSASGLSLSYIMDKAKDSDLVRITLVINHQQSLDRLYQLQDGTVYPAGYWVRKE